VGAVARNAAADGHAAPAVADVGVAVRLSYQPRAVLRSSVVVGNDGARGVQVGDGGTLYIAERGAGVSRGRQAVERQRVALAVEGALELVLARALRRGSC